MKHAIKVTAGDVLRFLEVEAELGARHYQQRVIDGKATPRNAGNQIAQREAAREMFAKALATEAGRALLADVVVTVEIPDRIFYGKPDSKGL